MNASIQYVNVAIVPVVIVFKIGQTNDASVELITNGVKPFIGLTVFTDPVGQTPSASVAAHPVTNPVAISRCSIRRNPFGNVFGRYAPHDPFVGSTEPYQVVKLDVIPSFSAHVPYNGRPVPPVLSYKKIGFSGVAEEVPRIVLPVVPPAIILIVFVVRKDCVINVSAGNPFPLFI